MAIPQIVAKFETTLSTGISSTATTAVISSATTGDGTELVTGEYGFVLDEGSSNEEFIIATVTGDALSSIQRGLSYVDGETTVTGNQKSHRKGAVIKMTDHPALIQYNKKVNGYVGHWEGSVANYAALPTGVNDGEARVTLDDSKLYVWDTGTTTWILAGSGGAAGTPYITVKLGSDSESGDLKTFTMDSGSFVTDTYLQVYKNGVLMELGASEDYTTDSPNGNEIVFNYTVLSGDKVTLVVLSVDLFYMGLDSVGEDIVPTTDDTYDIGSSEKQFKDIYISGSLIGDSFANYGDGADGDLVTSTDVTLTRDMFYDNLTISDGDIIYPNGFRIFVAGTLSCLGTGKVASLGGSGGDGVDGAYQNSTLAGGTAGTAAQTAGTIPATSAGITGASSSGTGTNGGSGSEIDRCIGNANASDGGDGGTGTDSRTGGIGGVGGTVGTPPTTRPTTLITMMQIYDVVAGTIYVHTTIPRCGSGGSGGGWSGSSSARGGSGGGSGGSGGVVMIIAKNILILNAGVIGGSGGDGGNGTSYTGNSGGGGGAGGNGGLIFLKYKSATTINEDVSGGAGGAGGSSASGLPEDSPGESGSNGASGLLITL